MKRLYVFADFDWLKEPRLIGELSYESLRGSDSYGFCYNDEWLKDYGGLFLSDDLNNYPGQQYTTPGKDIFGCFSDALSDRWERTLINRKEQILQMKIAVTYEGGSIFQHFGKTETFKMYEVEDGKITSMQIVHAGGAGHSALAGFLSEQSANVLICGGIGEGAQEALKEAGIKVISGAAGEVDAAVNAYLAGELESAGTNCDHHHEEGHSCCGQHEETATEEASAEEEHSCGGHCSGCSGCGGAHVRILKVRMSERPAVPITEVPLMMVPSLILPMTAESHWNLYAEPDR